MLKKIHFKGLFREVVFDKKTFTKSILLIIYSTLMVSFFPLITQFYIRVAYKNELKVLYIGTFVFFVLYVLKLFSDIKVDKFKNKFFIKLESNLQEKIIKKNKGVNISSSKFFHTLDKRVSLYSLFVRKILFENFENLIKIIFLAVVILFLDRSLVLYILLFIPIFVLYVIFIVSHFKKKKASSGKKNNFYGFGSFFIENFNLNVDDKFISSYKKFQSQNLEKEIKNRCSLVSANNLLKSSVTFFRLIYFAYFGYLVINHHISIEGLVVGLLFVTIFINSLIRIVQNIFFYKITRNSVEKINNIIGI